MGTADRLRVGIVKYLNSWPLAWAFLKGQHADIFEPVYLSPAEVADRMQAGQLEIGLLPSAELVRIPDVSVVPGLCIASEQEVNSVLLVSRGPLAEIRSVALDASSRTSAVLVRILLADRYGLDPEVHTLRPDLTEMLESSDAALLIGDAALKIDRAPFQVVDLAAEWRQLTDLPFVFAVWAVAAGVDLPQLPFYFHQSLRLGMASLPEIVDQAVHHLGVKRHEAQTYLTRNLKYRLGEEEQRSLAEFFRRGHRLGLLPHAERPRFLATVA